ncbi:kremen protein 2-like, partial [Mercenaria mercenaria]|uniref:kremen protein 2-like n=1 Tax=Mercenaria mercenaria TaxID=6596 RepID=UPI00234FA3BA
MDVWGCFILFYGIIISFLRVRSQQPPGYIGCFRMGTFGKITVRSIQVYNNGTYCIGFCKFSKHRFAGTQGHMCLCGNTILVDAKLPYCEYECPGHIAEFCGGVKKMSVYEIQ